MCSLSVDAQFQYLEVPSAHCRFHCIALLRPKDESSITGESSIDFEFIIVHACRLYGAPSKGFLKWCDQRF